jgi:hypothetical protein
VDISTGTGYTPRTFLHLYCAAEQAITPHVAGRVLARHGIEIEIQAWCRKCRAQVLYITDALPAGYQIYKVRITAKDGPHLPAEFRPVPYIEEEFEVVATSIQDAHERAEFAHSMRLEGQLVLYYIDGELHADERF